MEEILTVLERIQQQAKQRKEPISTEMCSEEITYLPLHPNRPMAEGDCPICRGEKFVRAVVDGVERVGNCPCVKEQIAKEQLRKTGIADSLERYTFENFQAEEVWQRRLKEKAQSFLQEKGKWFFVGGQVGCGKTHICTAMLGAFLKQRKSVKYVIWANEVVKLKANKMDDEAYSRLIEPLQNADVLYLDDFFKTEQGKKPSEADIKTAFEILNYRYVNGNLITLLSTEKTIDDLIEIDEAVGSRIYQKTEGYRNVIRQEKDRNWRLRALQKM